MRGADERSGRCSATRFGGPGDKDHPLRTARTIVNQALEDSRASSWRSTPGWPPFDPTREAAAGYAVAGALFDPRERRLMERLEFDLLFRCFVGLGVDVAGVGSLDVFCRNRW